MNKNINGFLAPLPPFQNPGHATAPQCLRILYFIYMYDYVCRFRIFAYRSYRIVIVIADLELYYMKFKLVKLHVKPIVFPEPYNIM